MLKRFSLDLKKEFQGYGAQKFTKDLLAGITVAAVALPLALAFGVASGADAAAGLITAILSGLLMSLLSGASYQISGPTGAMTAVLVTIVARYSLQGVFLACLMAGIFLVLAGILRLGKIVSFIPIPVITGFTSGIAVVIALGQIDALFGTVSHGETILEKLFSYVSYGFHPNLSTLLIGALVIAIMLLWPKKWGAKVPASLLAIIVAGLVCYFLNLDVPTVGEIPKTLFPDNRLSFSGLSMEKIAGLLTPALTIAALGMIESLLCASSASRMKGESFDADRELLSQGIGNVVLPFFGGVPSTAAIARTSVGIKSGGQTRLTGVFHSVFLLICMFVLSPVMSSLPLSALAGVLVVTAWRMNEWERIRYIFSKRFKGAILKFTVTLIATVVFDLTIAILLGILFSVLVFLVNISKLQISFSPVENSRLKNNDTDVENLHPRTIVCYITGPVFFTNSESVIKALREQSDCKKLLLSMRGVPFMDITALSVLVDFYEEQNKKGCDVIFCGLQDKVLDQFRRSGFYEKVPETRFFWSVDKALTAGFCDTGCE